MLPLLDVYMRKGPAKRKVQWTRNACAALQNAARWMHGNEMGSSKDDAEQTPKVRPERKGSLRESDGPESSIISAAHSELTSGTTVEHSLKTA